MITNYTLSKVRADKKGINGFELLSEKLELLVLW